MKWPFFIIVLLLVLVVIIGLERLGGGIAWLVTDHRRERVSKAEKHQFITVQPPSGSPQIALAEDAEDIAAAHPEHFSAELPPSLVLPAAGAGETIHLGVTGEVSPLHSIRSSQITGSTRPTAEQIERLRQATALVGRRLQPGAVIVDAEALSSQAVPPLLFARPSFDLTAPVKLAYDRLPPTAEPTEKTAAK